MRRLVGGLAVLLVMVLTACSPEGSGSKGGSVGGGAGTGPLPSSMAALGDSITAGYATCLVLADCPRNSWATGDGAIVASHYRRILGGNKDIKGHAKNFAEAGATAADLASQASRAAAGKPAYLTIMIGANDACRNRVEDMTSPTVFASEVADALGRVKGASSPTRILMVSIPDIYHLWEIGHGSRVARSVWADRVCPSLLANPQSEAAADVARRQQFKDRVDAYDRALEQACKNYGSLCRWDGGAVHGYQFAMGDISALDFFHPNAEGENRIAKLTYPSSFGWGGNAA